MEEILTRLGGGRIQGIRYVDVHRNRGGQRRHDALPHVGRLLGLHSFHDRVEEGRTEYGLGIQQVREQSRTGGMDSVVEKIDHGGLKGRVAGGVVNGD